MISRLVKLVCLFVCTAIPALDAVAQTPSCTFTLSLGQCVGCRTTWGPSYKASTFGCVSCFGWCMSYIAQGDEKGKTEILTISDPTATTRELVVPADLVREMAHRNPWAASTLLALQEAGSVANMGSGLTVLESLPTTEAVQAMVGGIVPKTLAPMPPGTNARVSHRLERGPGEGAKLFLSTFTVDADDRMLFKVYPDVVVDLVEITSPVSSGKALMHRDRQEGSAPVQLIALRWKIAE